MAMLLRIIRIPAILIWLIVTGFLSFFVHLGGWGAIKRVSFCSSMWGRGFIKILNIHIKVHGDPKSFKGGLIVSNHLGYIDILVHATIFPIRFSPKADIRKWPFLGYYLSISRPIWVDRGSRQKSQEVAREFEETMAHGIPLMVYPEGTSTDGLHGLLPFKSTPFESVTGKRFPILPIITCYKSTEDGQPVAWFGDMTLLPHLWRILGYRRIDGEVHILPTIIPEGQNRKELAVQVHQIMETAYLNINKNYIAQALKGKAT
jgi:1-acyl-sn-glycerol-3-phosphate acyltransferase